MSDPQSESPSTGSPRCRFWGAAGVLIAASLALVAGRIAVVSSPEGDTAFLSANDRSRWATVAALVDHGTYEIDRMLEIRDRTGRRRPWQSIDRVQHTGRDGRMHDYSSKPPLLATLVAAVYAPVRAITGMSLIDQPLYLTRILLALVNLPLLAVFLVATWLALRSDELKPGWGRLATLVVVCFGTSLLPMSLSLGNHLPAAAATAVALVAYLARPAVGKAFLAGMAAAFTVTCELPALIMLALWAVLFFARDPRTTLLGFPAGVAVVAFAFFGTNWLAHDTLIPPYVRRADGPVIGQALMATPTEDGVGEPPSVAAIGEALAATGEVHPIHQGTPARLVATPQPDRWIVEFGEGDQRFALVWEPERASADSTTVAGTWRLRRWHHWYDYPGSYWTTPRKGIDRGEESRWAYAFHATLGHHGLFSLTPFWLLVPAGVWLRLRGPGAATDRWLVAAIVAATLICFAFYIRRPLIDRNYGGVSCCFRWLLWFTPLWFWLAAPAAERLGSDRDGGSSGWSWRGVLLLGVVAASIFSVATALDNPWRHPWIYRYVDFLGWLGG